MKIYIEIDLIYYIKGIDKYAFGNDKNLYNIITSKRIKQSLNNGTIGYWLGKQFYSLKKLKPLLYKRVKNICPF